MTSLAAQRTLDARSVPDRHAPHLVMWNTTAFYALREELLATYHRMDAFDGGRLIGSVCGSLDDDLFVIGASAPFAGLDFARDYEPVAGIEQLWLQCADQLRALGVRRVEARLKPPHFSQAEPGVLFTLLAAGFRVAESNLNFFMDLRPWGSVEAYETSLKKPARRALRNGEALGLQSAELDQADDDGWSEAYEVLRVNRASKGRPTRLPFAYVRAIRDAFPGLVRMIVVRDGSRMCAAALLYRVAAGRDVVQYWGDAQHDLPHSPMNFLVREVVEHSIATGADVLDLGISTDHGEPNHGLIQFKRSIGASAEVRFELVCDDLARGRS